jgi:ABC-type phosphate/phosphonate transport system ATPase subunit
MDLTALDLPPLVESAASSAVPALTAENVWFNYPGGPPALRGVSLSVAAGRVTMILGRSGSGKTTLLKVLKGLLPLQRGTVKSSGASAAAGAAIAYIPQTLGLVRSLSALDNVLTGALSQVGTLPSLLGAFPGPVVAQAQRLMDQLGIGEKADAPVSRLSGGQRQRVAIARALIARPALVLADEFVSQLDALTARHILDMTRELARRGTAVLMTSHDPELVAAYADWLIVMGRGAVTYQGNPSELSQAQMVERLE